MFDLEEIPDIQFQTDDSTEIKFEPLEGSEKIKDYFWHKMNEKMKNLHPLIEQRKNLIIWVNGERFSPLTIEGFGMKLQETLGEDAIALCLTKLVERINQNDHIISVLYGLVKTKEEKYFALQRRIILNKNRKITTQDNFEINDVPQTIPILTYVKDVYSSKLHFIFFTKIGNYARFQSFDKHFVLKIFEPHVL